ncbi:MAG: AAA family ATPase [Candidatus Omnitrophica bacterium]|nr:AAA family ATPase [Candidatus Omnitrophota bacterium]
MSPEHIERTPEFLRAADLFEHSRKHIFLTGRAGTGKSTLLQYFRSATRHNVVVLAPTGVAAVNVRGQTIHSFFHFRPDVTPASVGDIRIRRDQRELYSKLDVVIVDEISMVRADLLDCMDLFLRRFGPDSARPFGGIRLVLIGDLYQLPPVVTGPERDIFNGHYPSPYFFDARVFGEMDIELVELETIWRQKEDRFIRLLNTVRDDVMSETDFALLNSRCLPGFEPSEGEFYVYLTSTNDLADDINRQRLSALSGKTFEYVGNINGKFEGRALPTQERLSLKLGAQVMLLNNDTLGRWINGSIGVVNDIIHGAAAEGGDAIRIRLAEGQEVDVTPFTWEVFRFVLNQDTERLESEPIGSFRQYPLRLAWAVTIHKSQGKTFQKVIIDIGRGAFSHGQVYVALSRCVSLQGIILRRPIMRRDIRLDDRVHTFLRNLKKRMRQRYPVLE